jgi:hypothetical protein
MICFLVGVIIALQSSYTLEKWGANRFIATLVAVSALREMAPLMTAILITGRSGSAITAEIGTMKVGEEIDALEVMGLSPIKYRPGQERLLRRRHLLGWCLSRAAGGRWSGGGRSADHLVGGDVDLPDHHR